MVDPLELRSRGAAGRFLRRIWFTDLAAILMYNAKALDDIPRLDIDLLALQLIDFLPHQLHLLHLGGHCILTFCQQLPQAHNLFFSPHACQFPCRSRPCYVLPETEREKGPQGLHFPATKQRKGACAELV